MGTGRAFDRKGTVSELVDWGSCVTRSASLDILQVTPLSYTP